MVTHNPPCRKPSGPCATAIETRLGLRTAKHCRVFNCNVMARGRSERRHPVPVAFFAVLLYFWGFLLLFWRPCYLLRRPVAFFLNPVTIFAVLLNRKGQKPNWEGKTPTGRVGNQQGAPYAYRTPWSATGPCATHIETRLGLRTTKHCRGCGLRGTAIDHSFRIHRQRTR